MAGYNKKNSRLMETRKPKKQKRLKKKVKKRY